jgi:hypothetical protein
MPARASSTVRTCEAQRRTHIRAAVRADLKKETVASEPDEGASRKPRREGQFAYAFAALSSAYQRVRSPRSINPAMGRGAASKQTQNLHRYGNSDLGAFSITFRLTRNLTVVELP